MYMSNGMLKINAQSLIKFIIIFTLFQGILISEFKLPGFSVYLSDILLLLAVALSVMSHKHIEKHEKMIIFYLIIYFFMTFFSYFMNYQNILYYIGGLRNLFRCFIFFLLCIGNFNIRNYNKLIKFLDSVFYLNSLIMLFQFFVQGLNQDYLGGIFGTSKGCNGATNIFFIIIVSKSVIRYLNKTETFKELILKCGLSLALAGIAEIKVFYIEFILIVAFTFLSTGFSLKKIVLILFSIIGILMGIQIVSKLFDMGYFFNINFIIKDTTSGSYSGSGDISRGAFIPIILQNFLVTNKSAILGLGLGNCDKATLFAGATPFYKKFGFLHYDWFTSMHTFLEQGWFGLILYLSFFIILFFMIRYLRIKNKADTNICLISELISILCIVIFFYNQSLWQDCAYLLMFVLSAPFIYSKTKRNDHLQKES